MMPQEIKRAAEKRIDKTKVADLLVRLIKTPSYQTELYEKDPMVQDFVRNVVYAELKELGIKDIAIDNMGNLIVRIKSRNQNRGRGSILYLAYAMTAAPGSMTEPFSGKVIDGQEFGLRGKAVLGRGACEQKASLASMMSAVGFIANSDFPIPGDLVFVVSTAGETGRHDSIREVIETDGVKTDYAIQSGEPRIQLGNKGRIDIIINVEGKLAHSSVPWEGINAIEGMFQVYGKLGKLMPNPGGDSHKQLGKATLTPIFLESFPRATHTVQSSCTLRLDRRLLPGEGPEEAISQVSSAVGDGGKYKVSVEGGPFMYPSEVLESATISQGLARAMKEMLGASPEYSYSHQALDAGYLNVKGIETVCYGSGQYAFAHTDVDIASIEDTVDAAKVFSFLALNSL